MAIGTTAALIGTTALSSGVSAIAADKASSAQEDVANTQVALQRDIYEDTTERFAPYVQGGLDFQNALRYELLGGERPVFGGNPLEVSEFTETIPGTPANPNVTPRWDDSDGELRLVGAGTPATTRTRYRVGDQVFDDRGAADEYAAANPTGGYEYQGFQETPGYQFAFDEGQRAIDTSAAASGNLFSGGTLKAQQRFGTGLANQEYNNYLNRLTGGAASGQAAAANQANAGANYGIQAGNAYANLGNAQAAGAIGVGNALNTGINNAFGVWNYQQGQKGQNALAPSQSLRPMARPF